MLSKSKAVTAVAERKRAARVLGCILMVSQGILGRVYSDTRERTWDQDMGAL